MIHINYELYVTVYGGRLDEEKISGFFVRAEDYVDSVTFGRITADVLENQRYRTLIAKACCACAECMYSLNSRADLITQEKVGNHAVSYAAPSVRDIERKKYSAVKMYLKDIYINGVGLMYRGAL